MAILNRKRALYLTILALIFLLQMVYVFLVSRNCKKKITNYLKNIFKIEGMLADLHKSDWKMKNKILTK